MRKGAPCAVVPLALLLQQQARAASSTGFQGRQNRHFCIHPPAYYACIARYQLGVVRGIIDLMEVSVNHLSMSQLHASTL